MRSRSPNATRPRYSAKTPSACFGSEAHPAGEMTGMLPLLQLPRIHFDFGAISVIGGELNRLKITRPLLVTDQQLVSLDAFVRVRTILSPRGDAAVFSGV